MSSPKAKTRIRKKSDGINASASKQKIQTQTETLAQSKPSAPEEPVLKVLSPQLRSWRNQLLQEIEANKQSNTMAQPVASSPAEAIAVNSELKSRLMLKKNKRRLFMVMPLIALLLYAGIYILRLDVYVPGIINIMPWPAAIANGRIIWLNDLKQKANIISRLGQKNESERLAIDQIIEQQIIENELARNSIALDNNFAANQLYGLIAEFGSAEAFNDYLLTNFGLQTNDFLTQVMRPYLRRLALFDQLNKNPEALASTQRKADMVLAKILSNELSYEQAVKQYSDDLLTRDQKGDLGWFTQESLPREFLTVLQKLKPGEISQPLLGVYGYHLFRLEDIDTVQATTKERGPNIRLSHIFFQTIDFENWLMNKKNQIRLVQLLPLRN